MSLLERRMLEASRQEVPDHSVEHVTGGTDKIRGATAAQDGLMTAAYASKLDGVGRESRIVFFTESSAVAI